MAQQVPVQCSFAQGPSEVRDHPHLTCTHRDALAILIYLSCKSPPDLGRCNFSRPHSMSKVHTHSHLFVFKNHEGDNISLIIFLRRIPFLHYLMPIQKKYFFSFNKHSIFHNIKSFCTGWTRYRNVYFWELTLICFGTQKDPKTFQWWVHIKQFTKRTLKSEDKHLCAKPLCLLHPFLKEVVIYTWGKYLHCFLKYCLKVSRSHLSLPAELIHTKCSYTDLVQK